MISIALFDHNPTMIPVAAGQALFREGEEGNMMFVLSTGSANVVINGMVVETLAHGSIVGEIGMVLPGPHSASVIARTDCEFVAVDEKLFQFLVQQTPFFATQVMRIMAERLRKADRLLAPAAATQAG